MVGLTERAINQIEVGTLNIDTFTDYHLPLIAQALDTTVKYILEGALNSERSTSEELALMRKERLIRSDDELKRVDEVAMETIRQRNNANIPLNRLELLALLEVIRGSEGHQLRF